jgi:DNA-binding MarR family transcriptional regulator
MRPIAASQSSLRFPLNEVLGTPGQVRLLRVLATEAAESIAPQEAAARTGMTESGARKALRRLERTGIVENVGDGRAHRYVMRREAGLAERIARLFELEQKGSDALVQALRRVLRGLSTPPKTAWVNHFLEGWADCLEIGVFLDQGSEKGFLRDLGPRLGGLEADFGVSLELRFFSQAELADIDWSKAVPLVGTPVADGPALNHRSAQFANALVSLLEEDLSLLKRAREHVDWELKHRDPGNGHDLWEWRKVLDTYPLPRLLNFLESDSPLAARLRQSSPFPAVLSQEELDRLGSFNRRPN